MYRSRIVLAIMAFLMFIPALNGSGAERQVGLAEAITYGPEGLSRDAGHEKFGLCPKGGS